MEDFIHRGSNRMNSPLYKKLEEITFILSHEVEHSVFNFKYIENKIIKNIELGFCFGCLFRGLN